MLPDPLEGLARHLNSPIGYVKRSLTHGDLNFTNLLLGLDAQGTPSAASVIDLANTDDHRVAASDLARLEVEYIDTIFRELLVKERLPEDEILKVNVQLLDDLNGLRPYPEPSPFAQRTGPIFGSLRFIHHLRRKAAEVLRDPASEDQTSFYPLKEYFYCLYFTSLAVLRFELQKEPQTRDLLRVKLFFLGASFASKYLTDLDDRKYTNSHDNPFRPICKDRRELA
jgi:hypothetical protein